MTKRLPEFPTDWHQERYVADLERELEGALVRGDKDYAVTVRAQLRRFGVGQKADAKPAKKPAEKSAAAKKKKG